MNGRTFEVGTDVNQVAPRPNFEEIQEIAYVAFAEATTLPQKEKKEVGRYLAQLSKKLLEKEG